MSAFVVNQNYIIYHGLNSKWVDDNSLIYCNQVSGSCQHIFTGDILEKCHLDYGNNVFIGSKIFEGELLIRHWSIFIF